MTQQQLIGELRKMVTKEGTQSALAKKLSISPAYLNDILQGLRGPGPALLESLGLEAIVDYRPSKRAERKEASKP